VSEGTGQPEVVRVERGSPLSTGHVGDGAKLSDGHQSSSSLNSSRITRHRIEVRARNDRPLSLSPPTPLPPPATGPSAGLRQRGGCCFSETPGTCSRLASSRHRAAQEAVNVPGGRRRRPA
jgi:hypothetical protein